MLPLDSPKWSELRHAYGPASDIPEMLRQLESFPPNKSPEAAPYFMLWSSLCHQGDVYTASYAAVPHIIRILATDPTRAHWDFFLLPSCIDIARSQNRGPEIPTDLRDDYFASMQKLPTLAAAAADAAWDETYCRIVIAAIVVAKGQVTLGEAILELEPDVAREFMESRFG